MCNALFDLTLWCWLRIRHLALPFCESSDGCLSSFSADCRLNFLSVCLIWFVVYEKFCRSESWPCLFELPLSILFAPSLFKLICLLSTKLINFVAENVVSFKFFLVESLQVSWLTPNLSLDLLFWILFVEQPAESNGFLYYITLWSFLREGENTTIFFVWDCVLRAVGLACLRAMELSRYLNLLYSPFF